MNRMLLGLFLAAFALGALLDGPSEIETMQAVEASVTEAGQQSAATKRHEAILKRSQAERELALGGAK